MIDSVVWAQYINVTYTDSHVTIANAAQRTVAGGKNYRLWTTFGCEIYRFLRQNAAEQPQRAIVLFKVIQGHRLWYRLKAHMRLPMSES